MQLYNFVNVSLFIKHNIHFSYIFDLYFRLEIVLFGYWRKHVMLDPVNLIILILFYL